MATGSRVDPYRGFNFRVEIDGITQAGFQEAGGLDASTAAVDYREGTDHRTRKLPGLPTFSPITLKRGITDSTDLYDWAKTAQEGKVQRKNGSIVLCDETGAEKIRWNFTEAWPSKWTGPSFSAGTATVAVESLEIVHEDLQRALS